MLWLKWEKMEEKKENENCQERAEEAACAGKRLTASLKKKDLCVCVEEERYTENANVREEKWRLQAHKQRIRLLELSLPCVSG